jgi:hypothetical protein
MVVLVSLVLGIKPADLVAKHTQQEVHAAEGKHNPANATVCAGWIASAELHNDPNARQHHDERLSPTSAQAITSPYGPRACM